MQLRDALKTTGAVRDFDDQLVSDDVLFDILDDARFAPSGGNRQAWHCIIVSNTERRERLRDLYLDGWHDYIAHSIAGLIPFSPLASDDDRRRALAQRSAAEAVSNPSGFAERLQNSPTLLLVTADLSLLAAVDRDLDRYQFAGGASLYPFCWSILLAARERGLGGVMTTMATRNEPEVLELFRVPQSHALAAVLALGYPKSSARRLTRRAVHEFTTREVFDGGEFTRPES